MVHVLGRCASPPDDNNAPSHSILIVTEFLTKHETKVIAQPPYSPDLAPSDFSLFPKLKCPLRGMRHDLIEAIKRNSLKELKAIPAKAYKECTENWIKRRHACIDSKGEYFEGYRLRICICILKYIKMLFFLTSPGQIRSDSST